MKFGIGIWLLATACAGCSPEVMVTNLPTDAGTIADGGFVDAAEDGAIVDASTDPVLELRADGSPCDLDAQCKNHKCIPSKNPFGMGICFSIATQGCIVVTEPSPHKKLCADETKRLFTCGDVYDVMLLGSDCEIVAVGDLSEYYHCCSVP